jgi:hypothetical protein
LQLDDCAHRLYSLTELIQHQPATPMRIRLRRNDDSSVKNEPRQKMKPENVRAL